MSCDWHRSLPRLPDQRQPDAGTYGATLHRPRVRTSAGAAMGAHARQAAVQPAFRAGSQVVVPQPGGCEQAGLGDPGTSGRGAAAGDDAGRRAAVLADGLRFIMAQESAARSTPRSPVHSARGLFQLTAANYHLNPNGARPSATRWRKRRAASAISSSATAPPTTRWHSGSSTTGIERGLTPT